MSKLLTVSVWLFVASALPGCIILPVPIPIPPSGTRGEVVEQLRIGESSRTEVHALLGEPNRLASARYDVYDLEYDPLHFYLIMGIGGPGGGGGDVVPLGERESRTRVAVEYDREGKIAGWRWEGRTLGRVPLSEAEEYRDYVYGMSEPGPAPVQPSWVLPWQAQAYALSPDGQRAALMQESRRLEVLETSTGRQIAVSREWPADCGIGAMALGFVATDVVSLPVSLSRRMVHSARGGFCRWQEGAGALVADPAAAPDMATELARARRSRLVGRFVIVNRQDGGISVWEASGAPVTELGSDRFEYVPGSATISADGSLLAVERVVARDASPTLVLHDIANGTQRVFTLPGPAHKPQPLAKLALAPTGDLLAIHRSTHIEVWRPGGPDETPFLETALPLPPPTIAGGLAFSADSSRLVAASNYILVWETQSWHVIGRGTSEMLSNAPTPSGELELTPDGSQIATGSGLWRIAPDSAHEKASFGATAVPADRSGDMQPPQ